MDTKKLILHYEEKAKEFEVRLRKAPVSRKAYFRSRMETYRDAAKHLRTTLTSYGITI